MHRFSGVMRGVDLDSLDFTSAAAFPNYAEIPLLPAPPAFAWYEDASTAFSTPAPRASA